MLHEPDPRNANIQVHVGGRLLPRAQAKISVFDSVVQGGDAVWEGLRVYDGRIAAFTAHLDRLTASAHALAFADIPPRDEIREAVCRTLAANGMTDGAHVRLTLTRGEKVTSGMNPRFNRSGSCLIVLAEWKAPVYGDDGIRLITSSVRRNNPQCLDSKIHHNNLLNNILACIEANVAGVDAALMLDLNGFVSEANDTNVFAVRGGRVVTPHADSCLPGITRATVLRLCDEENIPVAERNVSLTEFYTAEEAFTTGTMGELTPVVEIDGRRIGDGRPGPVTRRLSRQYVAWARRHGEPIT